MLNKKISYLEHYASPLKEDLLGNALNVIKSDKFRPLISRLRALHLQNSPEYDQNKRNLPGVTFCGFFHPKRTGEHLKEYNEIMVLDIDKLTEEQLLKTKKDLQSDVHVFAFWESPSGRGVKGLIKLRYKFDLKEIGEHQAHKVAFKALDSYFTEKYDIHLDASGCDITRLCFLSHDPNLFMNNNANFFEVEGVETSHVDQISPAKGSDKQIQVPKNILEDHTGKNEPHYRKTISDIIKYLKAKKLSITQDYDNWYRVGFAIAESFTYSVGVKYYLTLSSFDTGKFDKNKCEQMLRSCYVTSKHKIGFKTIIRLATEKGFVYSGPLRGVGKTASNRPNVSLGTTSQIGSST